MSNSVTQPTPSLQLGKYRLIIELAQGGMGNVYLAVASGPAGFSKLSVIKELKPSLLDEPGFLEMFLDEARLSARLSHQNVVQTNEVSVEGGRAFLAMEYLEGQSLVRVRSRLGKKQQLPLGAHLRIVAEACRGLDYAHTLCDFDGTPLGVVHRDVSPHNIFVTYDGQVKIVDFGVAKALSSNHETTVGVMKGKVPYMAPEQVMGADTDRRADVFALGVIIWEAVANRRMWDQQRTETILARLMSNDVPRLSALMPHAPPRLLALVDRATAASPDVRFPTAEALRLELEAYLHETGQGGHQTLREIGATMTEAFAYERAQVTSAVTEQLRLLRGSPDSVRGIGLVRLPSPTATTSHPSANAGLQVSGPYPQISQGRSEPPPGGAEGSGPSGSGSGSASSRFGRPPEASTSMALASSPRVASGAPPARARQLGVIALVVALGVVAVAGGVVAVKMRAKPPVAKTVDSASEAVLGASSPGPESSPSATGTVAAGGAGTAVPSSPPIESDAATSAPLQQASTTTRGRPVPPPRSVPPPRPTGSVVTGAATPAEPAVTTPPRTTKPDLGY